MDAMERCRRRLQGLLGEETSGGKLRQKTFAKYMGHSEAWLTNVLSGKRGLRLVDLDRVAEFFRLPVSELVAEIDTELIEVTPTERKLIRAFRRMDQAYKDSVMLFS